jgi:hypothetical protein
MNYKTISNEQLLGEDKEGWGFIIWNYYILSAVNLEFIENYYIKESIEDEDWRECKRLISHINPFKLIDEVNRFIVFDSTPRTRSISYDVVAFMLIHSFSVLHKIVRGITLDKKLKWPTQIEGHPLWEMVVMEIDEVLSDIRKNITGKPL